MSESENERKSNWMFRMLSEPQTDWRIYEMRSRPAICKQTGESTNMRRVFHNFSINDIKRNIDGEKIFVGEKVYVDNKDRETLMLLERYNASRIPPAPPIKVEPMKMPVGLIFYLDYTYNGEEVK